MDTCTCHSIRDGVDGITYSDAILGVRCMACELAEYQMLIAEEVEA